MIARRETARRQHRTAEADQRDAERGDRQRSQIARIDGRNAERRKSSRHLADDLDVARGRLEDGPEHAAEDDSGERARDAGNQALQRYEQDDQPQAKHRRQGVRLAEARHDLAELTQELARAQRDAEELAELPHDDAESGAVEKAGQDRAGQKIREEADARKPSDHREPADQQRENDRIVGMALRVAAGKGQKRGGHHRARRRVRPDNQLARRSEERIGHQRQHARVETDLGRETGQDRVGDGGRHLDGGDRQTREHVGRQPFAPIGPQIGQAGHPSQITHGECAQQLSGHARSCCSIALTAGRDLG